MKHCATAYFIPWYAKPIQLVLRVGYVFLLLLFVFLCVWGFFLFLNFF